MVGGPAECLQHKFLSDPCFACCFVTVGLRVCFAACLLQLCFAHVFCICVAIAFCKLVLHLCVETAVCICVLRLCVAIVFCNCALYMEHNSQEEVLAYAKPKTSSHIKTSKKS